MEAIKSTTGFSASRFTDICGGFDNWIAGENMLKYQKGIDSFENLAIAMPLTNHSSILISRVPLYRRWFTEDSDFKNIFVEQVVEYMQMGKLISEYFGSSAYLLASDHRAMSHTIHLIQILM